MPSRARAVLNRWTTPIWPLTFIAIMIGGAVGVLVTDDAKPTEATALIRLYQPVDPDQVISGAAPTADSMQSYISGEIAYLSSPGFSEAVAKHLNETTPAAVTAAQDAQSPIISLSSTETDPDAAQRNVDAALDVYRGHLLSQNRERSQAAMDAITAVIGELQDQIDPPNAEAPPTDTQARIEQLNLQRLSIEVQNRRGAPMQVVQPVTVHPETGVSTSMLAAVAGGLIGGLVALTGAHLWRRRAGVITSRTALEEHIENVVVPTVRVGRFGESDDGYLPLARKLYAQLPNSRHGRVLILGASADSGAEYVADLVAAAAREHGDVGVVRLHRGSTTLDDVASIPLPGCEDDEVTVVDGGSIESSPALPQAVKTASQVVVVAMVGRDVNESVRMARRLALHSDVPISAVCTRRASPFKSQPEPAKGQQVFRSATARVAGLVSRPSAPVADQQ